MPTPARTRSPHALTTDLRAELIALGAATLHEAQGQSGALDPVIKPLDPSMRLAGPAFTVAARPGDNLIVHQALLNAMPGDVLVVDAGGYLGAGLWGDILTEAARHRGLAGVVLDGAARDADAIAALGFPVFARGLSIGGTLKHQPGRIGVPVHCGGVQVFPGDMVVGDRDGVVAVPAGQFSGVLDAARERDRREQAYREQIRAGRTTVDLFGLTPTLVALGLA